MSTVVLTKAGGRRVCRPACAEASAGREKEKKTFLLASALNEQGGGGGLRFCFRGGAAEFPPPPPSAAPSLGLANFLAELFSRNVLPFAIGIFSSIHYFWRKTIPLTSLTAHHSFNDHLVRFSFPCWSCRSLLFCFFLQFSQL